MNRLVWNYPCQVSEVRDGRTFDGLWDFGLRQYSQIRAQLAGVELPNSRQDKSEEVRELLLRATQCLRMALIPPTLDMDNPGESGRRVVVAPLQPNKFNRAYVRVYVAAERENILYEALNARYAGKRFLDVNNFMNLLAENRFDLSQATTILNDFELRDYE